MCIVCVFVDFKAWRTFLRNFNYKALRLVDDGCCVVVCVLFLSCFLCCVVLGVVIRMLLLCVVVLCYGGVCYYIYMCSIYTFSWHIKSTSSHSNNNGTTEQQMQRR